MRSEQPFCIGCSVLVGLGMLIAPLVQVDTDHQNLGTNYGFGWHTADMSPDRDIVYQKV